MKHLFLIALLASFFACKQEEREAEFWLTDVPAQVFFERQEPIKMTKEVGDTSTFIRINPMMSYQEIDGFGYTLSQGSAQHFLGMSEERRAEILQHLFGDKEADVSINYLRLSIAASDLNERVFSYHDLEVGETDPELERFDLGPDREDVIPVLKEILAINPDLKLMGSPWSPPPYMKDNRDTRGGSLLPEFYDAYALYFVKYIQQMADEGISIDAVTVQNEPLHPGNNPSLLMLADEQAVFIKNHLGPAFEAHGIKTKIIIYDHNADRPDYPISILDDAEAKKYIHGSAFHLYGGEIEALSDVHKAHPDRHIYFTEQWVGAPGKPEEDIPWHVENLTIGATRNWARTVLEWNLSSNPELTPHTDRGGCDRCLGAITIAGDEVTKNPAYYSIVHASKFVPPGSIRIDTNEPDGISNVAFQTPDGKTILVLINTNEAIKSVVINFGEWYGSVSLSGKAVASIVI